LKRGSWRLVLVAAFLASTPAGAGRYPRVFSDGQSNWICTDRALVNISGDLWTFYTSAEGLPSDRVRQVAADAREVWAATPRGLGRMDRSSRRWTAYFAPDPLPSDNVLSVAMDDRYLWAGTAAGLVRYDKLTREFSLVDDPGGPGRQPIYDIYSQGLSVWFATAEGVFLYERKTGSWRHFGPAEGFTLGEALEIARQGDDLWFFCRQGLVRLDLRSRAVSVFSEGKGLPSPVITAFAAVEGEIWIGTDRGLVVYSPSADAISPFVYSRGMPSGAVRGIEVSLPWVYLATENGLGLFNTLQKSWEEKRESDGLESGRLEGLALAGSQLVLLQPGQFQGYFIQRDEWTTHRLDEMSGPKVPSTSSWRYNLEYTVSGEGQFQTEAGSENSFQLIPEIRLGAGRELDQGRSLDLSLRLDFGDVSQSGVREYDAQLRFRGGPEDGLQELLLSDEVPLLASEKWRELADDAWLEGAEIYQKFGTPRADGRSPLEVKAEAGLNRGVRMREFFRGSLELTYQLQKQYITPASEVVRVDGEILERGVDYIISHTTGQLTFLNPDRVNALSLIEITYTYEQIPRKAAAGASILQLLPLDNELGSFTRAGTPVYVTDEAGLYNQIDGAAPKYIDRGWVESVFQEYVQGAQRVKVEIHDMGSPENAEDIFEYDRPVSYLVLWDEPDSTALLDQSFASRYAVKMRLGRYYVELSIEGKSRAEEILITLFAQAVRTRGELSGTLRDSLRELVARLRLEASPAEGLVLGGTYLGGQELEDPELSARTGDRPSRYQIGMADISAGGRLGQGAYGGELQAFVQAAQSRLVEESLWHDGQAASGSLLYNAEALNLRLDGEYQSRDYTHFGSRQTALGTLAGQAGAQINWLPWNFLNLRLLYDYQRSYLGEDFRLATHESGYNQNLLGKVSFIKNRWPALWFLAGQSVLDAAGQRDEKLRLAGSLEYDLAQWLLAFTGMRRLLVKAYFDHSQNEFSQGTEPQPPGWERLGATPGQAQNLRLELKAAPTASEEGYVRFERKTFRPEQSAGTLSPMEWWELLAGASSRFLNGLVPSFNARLSFYDGSQSSGEKLQTAQSLLSGQLEVFPGQWLEALGPTMFSLGYGYTNAEESRNLAMQVHQQKHQIEGRLTLGRYDDPWRYEGRGKFWRVTEDERQQVTERYYESINRLTWRPIYTSPVSLRLDFSRLEQLVNNIWGRTNQIQPALEWERRWSLDLVSKVRLENPWRVLDDVTDPVLLVPVTFSDVALRPWGELRLRLRRMWLESLLRLTLRGYWQWSDWLEEGTGAEKAWEGSLSLYLDWEKAGSFMIRLGAQYVRHRCLERVDVPCASYHQLRPSITAIGRF